MNVGPAVTAEKVDGAATIVSVIIIVESNVRAASFKVPVKVIR